MNYVVILSAGIGSRMQGGGFPKQYIEVGGRPVISWTFSAVGCAAVVGRVVVVCSSYWFESIRRWALEAGVTVPIDLVEGGSSRQESVLKGLEKCMETSRSGDDKVIIHDAARPCVSADLIERCLAGLDEADGCMPVLPAVDTCYLSNDGKAIAGLIDRSRLFAGQAPEAFRLCKYYEANKDLTSDELVSAKGSSEAAYKAGLDVRLIRGEESNFKLTTPGDLERFRKLVEGEQ